MENDSIHKKYDSFIDKLIKDFPEYNPDHTPKKNKDDFFVPPVEQPSTVVCPVCQCDVYIPEELELRYIKKLKIKLENIFSIIND